MKLPVATPRVIEQLEELISKAPLGLRSDVMLHELSVSVSPVAVNEILSPGDPDDCASVKEGRPGAATVKVAEARSPSEPVTVTVYVLPGATLATTKNVPVRDVPPPDMTHAEEKKRPLGAEEIVHEAASPLLNCPVTPTVTVVPGGSEADGVKVSAGAPSIVKATIAESPVFPVTVILVSVFASTETPTLKDPVIFPPLTLQL